MQVSEEGSEVIAYIPSLLSPTIHDKSCKAGGMILAQARAPARHETSNRMANALESELKPRNFESSPF